MLAGDPTVQRYDGSGPVFVDSAGSTNAVARRAPTRCARSCASVSPEIRPSGINARLMFGSCSKRSPQDSAVVTRHQTDASSPGRLCHRRLCSVWPSARPALSDASPSSRRWSRCGRGQRAASANCCCSPASRESARPASLWNSRASEPNSAATVLAGRCDEEALVPYQPFVEALTWYARVCPEPDLRAQLAAIGGGAELGPLIPELLRRVPDLPDAAADESGRPAIPAVRSGRRSAGPGVRRCAR